MNPSQTDLHAGTSAQVDELVHDVLGHVADKWTMIILEALEERQTLRFSELVRAIDGISQKMLTQTLRQMERDGLVRRTVHPVVPPHVDYALTALGHSLGEAFCSVWRWAEAHYAEVQEARLRFSAR